MRTWTLDNPVITKELRGRMRGSRTYWLLFGYLLLLSLILFFSYLTWWNTHSQNMQVGGAAAGFTIGRTFFKILFYAQAVMIALITPALTAGAISSEREQRTFEMLRSTILRPREIVWGKLISSVSFVVLLLTSSLPLLSLCFLLGGVSPGEVFFAYLLLAGDALLFGAMGLAWSAFAANTATSTVLSYVSLFVFFVLTVPFAASTLFGGGGGQNIGLSALNPLGAVTAAVTPEHYYRWVWPAWFPALLLNGTLTTLLVLACINRLEDFPMRRAAALRLVTLLFACLIIFFSDGLVMASWRTVGVRGGDQLWIGCVIAFVVALLFSPVLVTGDLAGWGQARATPRRIFSDATLPSGLPLALILAALALSLTFAAAHLGGNPLRALPILPTGHAYALLWPAGLMLFAIVFGVAGIGFLLSLLLNNRWAALTLTYLVIVLGMALPGFAYGGLSGPAAAEAAHNPAINSLYLCPIFPLLQLRAGLDLNAFFGRDDIFRFLAGYNIFPLWVTTSSIYAAIGLLSYAVSFALLRQKPQSKQTA